MLLLRSGRERRKDWRRTQRRLKPKEENIEKRIKQQRRKWQ